jgi:hypothetical protein
MFDFLEDLISQAMEQTGLTKEGLLESHGVGAANYRKYKRLGTLPSDGMLQGFSSMPGFPDYPTLLRLRAEEKNPEIKATQIPIDPEEALKQILSLEKEFPGIVERALKKTHSPEELAELGKKVKNKK